MRKTALSISLVLLLLLSAACEKPKSGIYASGTVEAREVLISSKVAGEIKKVLVNRSDKVEEGAALVEIDPSIYEIQTRDAGAAVGAATSILDKAENGLRPEEIDQAKEAVNAADAQFKLAGETLDRMKELLDRQAISQQDYDTVKSQYDMAQANLEAKKKQHTVARKGARNEDIDAARYQVERARAARDMAALQKSYSNVRSPAAMTVSEIYVEEGELAGQGTALILLQDLSEFHIDVFVSINDISKVKEGDKVDVKVTGFSDLEFHGAVELIKPRAEFTPENITTEEGRSHLVFKVRVKMIDGAEVLKPGLPADARILSEFAEPPLNFWSKIKLKISSIRSKHQ